MNNNLLETLKNKKQRSNEASISKENVSPISVITLFFALFLPILTIANEKQIKNNAASLPNQITTSNTSVVSNNIKTIFHDESGNIWFGTDKGLSFYNSTGWTQYTTSNNLPSNKVNDLANEKTTTGNDLLIATEAGLAIASYNANGIVSTKSYTSKTSGMVGDVVKKVIVDKNNTRWIATDKAVNTFKGTKWENKINAPDSHDDLFTFADYPITDLKEQVVTDKVLITTKGKGMARMGYSDVDGISGASTHGFPWYFRQVSTPNGEEYDNKIDTIYTVYVTGEKQWYGTTAGAFEHRSLERKEDWTILTANEYLVDNNIRVIHLDKNGNVWMGTDKGISIVTPEWKTYKYTKDEGLIGNVVNAITSDNDGNVWIATESGAEWTNKIMGIKVSTDLIYSVSGNNAKVLTNPATNKISIDFNFTTPQVVTATVFNINGQVVGKPITEKVSKGKILSIPVSDKSKFSKGFYLLKVKGENFNQVLKINIQ